MFSSCDAILTLLTNCKFRGRPDPIGIYLDGTLWSIDGSNQRITATSEYLNGEIGISEIDKFDFGNEMNRATRYDGSSPPLLIGIPANPGEHTMIFAICDSTDGDSDSGLMVKAKGCKDCNPQVRINYVSITTTTGSTSFTSTTKAIGTESGTVLFGVPAEETTTATEDITTTATDTSTTNESSATTDTAITTKSHESSTATSGIVFTDSTTQALDQSSTATSTLGTTTEESSTLETSTVTTVTHDSSSTTESLMETGSTSPKVSTILPESSTMTKERTASSSTTVFPITTSTEGIDTQTPSGETTQPGLPDATSVEDVQSTRSIEQSNSLTTIVPDSTSSALSPTETASPTNLEVIGDFTFLGCLGSPDGYPSFDLVATSDDMTPSKCVSLTTDRLYVGIYDRLV